MATSATVSKGATLKIKNTAATPAFIQIKEMKDFSGIGGGSPTIIDASHLESTAKEKQSGLMDEGSVKFTHNYIPNDPGQMEAEAARSAGTVRDFELTFAGKKHAFQGIVMTMEKSGGVDKLNELGITVEITGSVTVSAAV